MQVKENVRALAHLLYMQSTKHEKEKLTKSRPTKQCQVSTVYFIWNLSLIEAATSLSEELLDIASIENSIAFFIIVGAISELFTTGLGRGWLMADILDVVSLKQGLCNQLIVIDLKGLSRCKIPLNPPKTNLS